MSDAQSAFKPKSKLWGISMWKQTNWRISVLQRTRKIWIKTLYGPGTADW